MTHVALNIAFGNPMLQSAEGKDEKGIEKHVQGKGCDPF
jgi:hypothetical protein